MGAPTVRLFRMRERWAQWGRAWDAGGRPATRVQGANRYLAGVLLAGFV